MQPAISSPMNRRVMVDPTSIRLITTTWPM